MIIIGEKINGTRKAIGQAILFRDKDLIESVAVEQAEAGAGYIDINAGTAPDRETEDMLWLIETVEAVTDVPLCIDSSSPQTLIAALAKVKLTPMINSINADPKRLDSFLPIIQKSGSPVIALAMDESKSGMPKTLEERIANLDVIFEATRSAKIDDTLIFVDPLIMTISTDSTAAVACLDTIKAIHERYPKAHITGGLSNISFGLPERGLLNRTFLALAMMNGLDSAVINPNAEGIVATMKAVDALLNRDRFCRNYTKAAKNSFKSC